MSVGKIDYPIKKKEDDKLSLHLQTEGFAAFIRSCQTPMTIAIQGEWGSGKTSFVNIVMNQIKNQKDAEDYIFITFNAWQFTQFNMSEQLLTSMLSALTKEVQAGMPKDAEEGKEAGNKINMAVKALKVAGYLANDYAKKKTGVDVIGGIKNGWKPGEKKDEDPDDSMDDVHAIMTLKENFQKCIDARLGITEENRDKEEIANKRIIFFVDDLDRLTPDRAIEVLEVLKIFLDCEHCVFLLAIDYSVVVNGVAIKYKNTLSADKGKDFFEKMIQVVYTLPDTLVHTERYIANILRENGVKVVLANDFAELVKSAGKDNPRSIKRLLNSFFLLETMKVQAKKYSGIENTLALFSVVCLQNTCEKMYSYLLHKIDRLTPEWFNECKAFCYNAYYSKELGEGYTKEELAEMGLLKTDGSFDRRKLAFMNTFFEKIFDGVLTYDFAHQYTIEDEYTNEHIVVLREALTLTEMTRLKDDFYTDDDYVALVLMMGEAYELVECTITEAYQITCKNLIWAVPSEKLQDFVDARDYLSFEEKAFERAFAMELDEAMVYLSLEGDANKKVLRVIEFSKAVECGFEWFRDYYGRRLLVKGYEVCDFEDTDELEDIAFEDNSEVSLDIDWDTTEE